MTLITTERGVYADPEAISSNGEQTISHAEAYQSQLQELASNMQALMGIWNGAAAEAFEASYQAENETFEKFQRLLDRLGEALKGASKKLQDAEDENAEEARGLEVR